MEKVTESAGLEGGSGSALSGGACNPGATDPEFIEDVPVPHSSLRSTVVGLNEAPRFLGGGCSDKAPRESALFARFLASMATGVVRLVH